MPEREKLDKPVERHRWGMALLRSGPARIDTQLDGCFEIGVAVADHDRSSARPLPEPCSRTIPGLVFSEAGVVANHAVEEIEPPELIQLLSCRSLSVVGGEPDQTPALRRAVRTSCAPSREIRSAGT